METSTSVIEGKRRDERLDPERAARIRRDPPEVMTIPEAAAFLTMSPRTVRSHITAGRLSAARLGARVLVVRDVLKGELAELAAHSA